MERQPYQHPLRLEQSVAVSTSPLRRTTLHHLLEFAAPNVQSTQSLQALQLVGAKFLVAGTVGNLTHLYVLDDSNYHRVLDFEVSKSTVPSTTSVAMKLDRQYVSSRLHHECPGTGIRSESTFYISDCSKQY